MRSEHQANQEMKAGSYDDAYHARCRVSQRRAEQKAASDRRKVFLFKLVCAAGAICLGAKMFYVATA